jgi:hypothetical protein
VESLPQAETTGFLPLEEMDEDLEEESDENKE